MILKITKFFQIKNWNKENTAIISFFKLLANLNRKLKINFKLLSNRISNYI